MQLIEDLVADESAASEFVEVELRLDAERIAGWELRDLLAYEESLPVVRFELVECHVEAGGCEVWPTGEFFQGRTWGYNRRVA